MLLWPLYRSRTSAPAPSAALVFWPLRRTRTNESVVPPTPAALVFWPLRRTRTNGSIVPPPVVLPDGGGGGWDKPRARIKEENEVYRLQILEDDEIAFQTIKMFLGEIQ